MESELKRLQNIFRKFNLFSILGIANWEIKHSNFLSWLFNPKGNHGLGEKFLSLFLESVKIKGNKDYKLKPKDLIGFSAIREENNMDITLQSRVSKFICIIENKIHAPARLEQLKDYRKRIEASYTSYTKIFVFLTMKDIVPPEPENKYWIQFSFREINQIIEKLINENKKNLDQEVVMFINQYTSMIRRNFMKDDKFWESIKELYVKYKDIFQQVNTFIRDRQKEVQKEIIKHIKNDETFIIDKIMKGTLRFIPKNLDSVIPKDGIDDWSTKKRVLLFELWNSETHEYIDLLIFTGHAPINLRKRLYKIAENNQNIFKIFNSKLQNFNESESGGNMLFRHRLVETKNYEQFDSDEVIRLFKVKFEEFCTKILPSLTSTIIKEFQT